MGIGSRVVLDDHQCQFALAERNVSTAATIFFMWASPLDSRHELR
jgi:hypothetical protein